MSCQNQSRNNQTCYHKIISKCNPENLMCGKHSVMRCDRADSFPLKTKYLKPKLKTVSTKLSEFPHHTTYHTNHVLSGISGCPTYPPMYLNRLRGLLHPYHYHIITYHEHTARNAWVLTTPSVSFNRYPGTISPLLLPTHIT